MKAIRILAKCAAGGQHLPAGKVCRVPEQVSAEDAVRLVRMHRAEEADAKAAKADAKAAKADAKADTTEAAAQ